MNLTRTAKPITKEVAPKIEAAVAKPAAPGRPKDQEKRAALIHAAAQLFCVHGYDNTSVEQIAAAAGVSKLTVYSHFAGKEELFHAAVSMRCEASLPHRLFEFDPTQPLDEALNQIGLAFMDLVFAEDTLNLYRVLISQGGANQRLAQLFFETGPKRTLAELQTFLAAAKRHHSIAFDDLNYAAECFFILLKGLSHIRVLLGYGTVPSAAQRRQHVAQAVQTFLNLLQGENAPSGTLPTTSKAKARMKTPPRAPGKKSK